MTADLELQSLGETDALLKTSERPKKRALAIQIIALCGAAALAGAALNGSPDTLSASSRGCLKIMIWQKLRPDLMTSLPDSWISHASCSRSSFPSRGARSRRRRGPIEHGADVGEAPCAIGARVGN